jgi:hypothetical protein
MILFNNQREFFSIVQVGTAGWEYLPIRKENILVAG